MNKLLRSLFFCLLFSPAVFVFAEHAFAVSADSKTEELEEEFTFQKNTLAPPLMGSAFNPDAAFQEGVSLLRPSHEPGHWGDLSYELMEGKTFRLQGRDLKKSSGFFWLFDEPLDLRNRWVEIIYSGMAAPSQISMNFESGIEREDANFTVPLKNSFEPKASFFKLPERTPFSKIQKLSFNFEPAYGKDIEILILDLKVLPEGFEPLRTRSAADAGQ